MGFNKKGRNEAKARETQAFNDMRSATQAAEKARADYMANFATRNKGMIAMQESAFGRVRGYETGQDIGKRMAGMHSALRAGAQGVMGAQRLTSGMGTNALAQQDPRYAQKLQSLASRNLASQIGGALAEQSAAAYQQDIGTAMGTSQFLNTDMLAGVGGMSEAVQNYGNVGNFASRIRKTEIEESQRAFNNLMGVANFAVGAVTGIGGMMNASKMIGKMGAQTAGQVAGQVGSSVASSILPNLGGVIPGSITAAPMSTMVDSMAPTGGLGGALMRLGNANQRNSIFNNFGFNGFNFNPSGYGHSPNRFRFP